MRNTELAPRLPLVERNRGRNAEHIGKAQDTGDLRARKMHDPNFVCAALIDIALSITVKTLSFPAIENSEGSNNCRTSE
jgi:hypothetical protein